MKMEEESNNFEQTTIHEYQDHAGKIAVKSVEKKRVCFTTGSCSILNNHEVGTFSTHVVQDSRASNWFNILRFKVLVTPK